jgi:hypothetical protein
MNIVSILTGLYYYGSRLVMMYGMYCICSACGAYIESKGGSSIHLKKEQR